MRKRFLQAGLIIGGWTLLALLFVPQTYYANSRAPSPMTVWDALVANLVLFYRWAALTPLVLWLGRRFPIERKRIFRNLLILILLEVPVALFQLRVLDFVNRLIFGEAGALWQITSLKSLFIWVGAFDVQVYWSLLAVSQALAYFRKYQEREFRLAQAQLQMLKMQLHPHFLFNTLNAISELVYESPKKAERTITQLSDLLRLSLKGGGGQEVTLKEELEFLRKYVEIQQTLLQERLAVRWEIEDETLDALVPNMLLQPLIENSIRHGIAGRARGGRVEVSARREDGMLRLEVCDDGVGFPAGGARALRYGVGLSNARARLEHLYGGAHRFRLGEGRRGGAAVSIEIPFRECEGEAGEDTHADS